MIEISVIVPVYNVEKHIVRCLQSVMDQSYRGPVECVIVDDCGTDHSMEIVTQMLGLYHGHIDFKVVHHDRNRGLSAARNTGTEQSKGEYVFYLDSDDALNEDCLKLMAVEVEKHPGLEMVMGAHQIINIDTNQVQIACKKACYVDNNDWIRFHFFKKEDTLRVVAWNKLIKRSFVTDHALYFKEGLIHEDELWSFVCYRKLKSLSIIDDVTYLHFITPNSIITTSTNVKRAEAWRIILNEITKTIDAPFRELQVYKYFLLFLDYVCPFVPKQKLRFLFVRFIKRLLSIGDFQTSFLLFINSFYRFRYSKLYNRASLKYSLAINEDQIWLENSVV